MSHAKDKHEAADPKKVLPLGGQVFFVPDPADPIAGGCGDLLAATVAAVNPDGTVNLSILCRDGSHAHKSNVEVNGGGHHTPAGHGFCQTSATRDMTLAEAFGSGEDQEPGHRAGVGHKPHGRTGGK